MSDRELRLKRKFVDDSTTSKILRTMNKQRRQENLWHMFGGALIAVVAMVVMVMLGIVLGAYFY